MERVERHYGESRERETMERAEGDEKYMRTV